MKKTVRKTLAIVAATLTMATISVTSLLSVAAEEPVSPAAVQTTAASGSEESISPRRDDIIVKYRMYNGCVRFSPKPGFCRAFSCLWENRGFTSWTVCGIV